MILELRPISQSPISRSLIAQRALNHLRKRIEGLRSEKLLAVDVEDRLREDATRTACFVQFQHVVKGIAIVVTRRKRLDIGARSPGSLNIVVAIGAPQIALVLEQYVVHVPEGVNILARDAFGCQRRIKAGIAVVQDGPEDDARLPAIHVRLYDLGLCA